MELLVSYPTPPKGVPWTESELHEEIAPRVELIHLTTDYLIYSAEYQLYKTKKNGKLGKFGCNDENYRHYYIKQFLPD